MATVTVNLGSVLGPVTYRGSGFLHGLNATLPPAALVTPLKGRLWRGSNFGVGGYQIDNIYPRVFPGATVTFSLGESWGYSTATKAAVASGDFSTIDPIITTIVTKYRDKAGGAWTIGHDLWNEPNHPNYWSGTAAQFRTAWKHIYDLVRSLRPGATIVGPSMSIGGSGITWASMAADTKALLAFGNTNACLPDRLSWHETGNSQFVMVAHVQEMEAWMDANLSGGRLPIEINEITGDAKQWQPSESVTYLAASERALIFGAAKSWWSPDLFANLDGLLTDPPAQPRSLWWAYQKYGEMLGNIMTVTTTVQEIDGVAAYDGTTVRALIANHTATGGAHTVTMSNIPAALVSGGKVRITTQAIANSEQAAVAALPAATTTDVTVVGNAASVSPTIGAWGAMSVVVVSPGVSSAAFTVSGGGGAYAITGSTATLAKSPGPTLIGFVHIVGAVFFVRATSVALLIGAL